MKPIKQIKRTCLLALVMSLHASLMAEDFTDTFHLENCHLQPKGVNPYFIPLVPGSELLLMGEDEGEVVAVLISVLNQTEVIDGVRCRVIQETEWVDEELVEVSRNFFAFCKENGNMFYFGEDVDIYEDGEVVSHDGAWRAGVDGARAGLIMPGSSLVGSKYYQEVAPGLALDRAEHTSTTATIQTPAGTFENCLEIIETSPLEPGHESYKAYAPGIGLVQDGVIKLVRYYVPKHHKKKSHGHDRDDDE